MILYRINGNYPDMSFNFTLTAENMNLAPKVHSHTYESQDSIVEALSGKADTAHTHECVQSLYTTEITTGTMDVTLTAVATTGSTNPTIGISNQDITIGFVSPQTNNIFGILEQNPEADKSIVQLYGGTIYVTDSEELGIISMEENIYA